eukprot:237243-Lingulodinium_polyedra.AAC.1
MKQAATAGKYKQATLAGWRRGQPRASSPPPVPKALGHRANQPPPKRNRQTSAGAEAGSPPGPVAARPDPMEVVMMAARSAVRPDGTALLEQ